MAQEPQPEDPILSFEKASMSAVQQVLDRAQRAVARASNEQLPTNSTKRGLLTLVLDQAMAAHGRTATSRISIRKTATDTGGRPYHFAASHITKGKRAKRGEAGKDGGDNGIAGSQSANGKPTRAPGAGKYKAKTREGAHQAYAERGGAVERENVPLETLDRPLVEAERGVESHETRSAGGHNADLIEHISTRPTDLGDGMEDVEDISVEHEGSCVRETGRKSGQQEPNGQTAEAGRNAGRTGTARIDDCKLSAKDWVTEGMRDKPGLSAASSEAAAQAYLEDPSKVAKARGTTSSFGMIGDTIEERMAFWDLVNAHESSAGGRTQSRLVLELPHEATPRARHEIVRRYVQEEFGDRGIPYWATIHQPTTRNDYRNYHAHVVFTGRPMRMMDHPETGGRVWDFTVEEAFKDATRHTRTRHPHRQKRDSEMRKRTWVKESRARFADIANDVMVENGLGVRYDPRSYRDMGLDVAPMKNVDRILTDRSKTQRFVVMDAEWTRRMIDAEMREAALRRDETYQQLRDIEARIQDAVRQRDRAKKANERLPRGMAIAPGRRVTAWLAERVGGGLLEVESARLSAQFIDEATERTLSHVIEATGPKKTARGEARVAPGAPDQESLTELHRAAKEELAAFQIERNVRSKGYRQAGNKFKEAWKRGTQAPSPKPISTIEEPGPHARVRNAGTITFGAASATPLTRETAASGLGPRRGHSDEGGRTRSASPLPSRSELHFSMRALMTVMTGTNQRPDPAALVAAARAFAEGMAKMTGGATAKSASRNSTAPAVVASTAVTFDTAGPAAGKAGIAPRPPSAPAAARIIKEESGKVPAAAQEHDQPVTSGSAVGPVDTISEELQPATGPAALTMTKARIQRTLDLSGTPPSRQREQTGRIAAGRSPESELPHERPQEQLPGNGGVGEAGPNGAKKGAETAPMPHRAGPSTAAPDNAGFEPVAGDASEEEREAKRKRRKAILAARARGRGM